MQTKLANPLKTGNNNHYSFLVSKMLKYFQDLLNDLLLDSKLKTLVRTLFIFPSITEQLSSLSIAEIAQLVYSPIPGSFLRELEFITKFLFF